MVAIDQSIAHQSGGGVYVGISNNNIQMDNMNITSCMSYSSGGGIQIYSQNKNLVLRQIKADHCSSETGDGGALSIFQYNNNVIITNSTFSYSTANYGGAISIISNNSYINIAIIVFHVYLMPLDIPIDKYLNEGKYLDF